MRKWLIGLLVAVAGLGAFAWWAVLDGAAPARADGVFDLGAYRALVAEDGPNTLPTAVRIEFIGQSTAPSFAAEAGAFDGERTFTYPAFEIASSSGATIIDAALDEATLAEMAGEGGQFDQAAYQRLIAAMTRAAHILITHEHLDHVMAIARHPAPAAIAPQLRLTAPQLEALPQHAVGGALPADIAAAPSLDFAAPTRIAPGVVAHAAPGHSLGTIVIFVRTTAREYLFIGDIAWQMSSIENARGRPRLVGWLVKGVDPDRPAVLRQVRALHDLGETEPNVVIVPAHDAAYLRGLVESGVLSEGFAADAESAPAP